VYIYIVVTDPLSRIKMKYDLLLTHDAQQQSCSTIRICNIQIYL